VEKVAALRRCVAKVTVEAQAGRAVVGLRVLPVVGMRAGAGGEMVELEIRLH
jgi:hypothetical protein